MMFDSDVMIWFLRGESRAVALIDSTAERAISLVTVMEVLQGARSKAEMRSIRSLFQETGFRILPITEQIGYSAAAFIEEHAVSDGLRVVDALIAATAVESGQVLATANHRHFRFIRGLEVKAFRPGAK